MKVHQLALANALAARRDRALKQLQRLGDKAEREGGAQRSEITKTEWELAALGVEV